MNLKFWLPHEVGDVVHAASDEIINGDDLVPPADEHGSVRCDPRKPAPPVTTEMGWRFRRIFLRVFLYGFGFQCSGLGFKPDTWPAVGSRLASEKVRRVPSRETSAPRWRAPGIALDGKFLSLGAHPLQGLFVF